MFATALAVFVLAAPVPKQESDADRMIRLFGKPVDRVGGCRFEMTGEKLTITAPKGVRRVALAEVYAPHTVREVTGDVRLSVAVTCRIPDDGGRPATEGQTGKYAAGLLLSATEDGFASVNVHRFLGGKVDGEMSATSEAFGPKLSRGDKWVNQQIRPDSTVHLRLTRRGPAVSFAYSLDGTGWTDVGDTPNVFPEGLPAKVRVGVYAEHDAADGFSAVFENFRVEPLPAEGRR